VAWEDPEKKSRQTARTTTISEGLLFRGYKNIVEEATSGTNIKKMKCKTRIPRHGNVVEERLRSTSGR